MASFLLPAKWGSPDAVVASIHEEYAGSFWFWLIWQPYEGAS